MAQTSVGRDPFARGEYIRESHTDHLDCSWCGQRRRVTYTYTWESDGGRNVTFTLQDRTRFCNLECFRSYHSRDLER